MAENLQQKKIGVVGLGPRTGVSVVRFLSNQGALVLAYDAKDPEELTESLSLLKNVDYRLETGKGTPSEFFHAEQWIVSPGVSLDQPLFLRAKAQGISIVSEVEFSARRILCPILAVTGTNGKSTTTSLLAHLLRRWGKRIFAGGNLGQPLVEACGKSYDFVVAEVSSFQLEIVETFHPHVAILLNVSPNHLDRHKTMEAYISAKERLFANMGEKDRAILNGDDCICQKIGSTLRFPQWHFSLARQDQGVICQHDGFVYLPEKSRVSLMPEKSRVSLMPEKSRVSLMPEKSRVSLKGFSLFGAHNVQNAMAAVAAAFSVGCPLEVMEQSLPSFQALEFRLQLVGEKRGVRFVNDSKSTSPAATIQAIQSFDQPIVLLAGGRSKGCEYSALAHSAIGKVKEAIFFGEASHDMAKAFSSVPHQQAKHVKEAFAKAMDIVLPNDVVLFSPANASFDQFKDFEDRGRHFNEIVQQYLEMGA